MKKFAFIMAPLLCLTVMFFTACSNTNKASSSVAANKAQTSKVESNASDKPSPALSGMDVFAIWKNDIAACNNDENIYIVSRTQIGKIDKQGKVSVLSKGLLKGNDIALHNNYIYFIDGIKLCHIDKDGKNKYTFN